jgi:hypothetical protein
VEPLSSFQGSGFSIKVSCVRCQVSEGKAVTMKNYMDISRQSDNVILRREPKNLERAST